MRGTESPQGCVLSPRLYSLRTHDCTANQNTNCMIKYADDTTVVGLITSGDESRWNYPGKNSCSFR